MLRAPRVALALSVAGAFLMGCSREARAVRLRARNPSEEIYRIDCGNDIGTCEAAALKSCAGSYTVLESRGGVLEPKRMSSAPGPRSLGPRYRRSKWRGQMVVVCGKASAGTGALVSSDPPPKLAAPPAALPPGKACIPGTTQACLGPGACRGAQACTASGESFGSCDCGGNSTSTRSGIPPEVDPGAADMETPE